MTATTSIDRILEAASAVGLKVRQEHDNDYMMQCPVHQPDNNPSVHVTYFPSEGLTKICDFHDKDDETLGGQILEELGLGLKDLYDNPKGRAVTDWPYSRAQRGPHAAPPIAGRLRALAGRAKTVEAEQADTPLERFTMPKAYASDGTVGLSAEAETLYEKLDVRDDRPTAACPVCGVVDALHVLYVPLQQAVLLYCKECGEGSDYKAKDYAAKLTESLGVDPSRVGCNDFEIMVYDSPAGVTYTYEDGLVVHRSPAKKITQSGPTKGKHPLWMASQVVENDYRTVFFVEGEKDTATLWACGYAAVTAQGGGGSLKAKLNLDSVKTTLAGRDVIAVVDKDKTGSAWRSQVERLVGPVAKSLTFVQAHGLAHDTTDAIMMGTGFDLLPEQAEADPLADVDPDDVDPDDDDENERFERFWDGTPYLSRIRDVARQSLTSPWAVFMALLARVSTVLPPDVVIPNFVGGACASLNLFVALVGPSGTGKGAAESVAEKLMPDIRGAVTSQPGSGEGIVTMFCERVADESGDKDDGKGVRTILQCVNRRALLSVPEVSALGGVMARQGSTLSPELTRAWSGEELGSRTKYAANTFRAPRYGYRLGLVTGVQPGNAAVLFNEAETGLPQRFLWADVQDDPRYAIPYEQWNREPITPLVDATRFPDDTKTIQTLYRQGSRWNMLDHGSSYPLTQVRYPETARRATFENQLANNTTGRDGDGLDKHGNLVRLKVAALLPWLDPERDDPLTVTEEDWERAGEVLAYSQRVRGHCLEAERDRRRERAADRAKDLRAASREADDEQDELRAGTPRKIIQFLSKSGRRGKPFTGKQIRNGVRPKWRPYVYDSLVDMAKDDDTGVSIVKEGGTVSGSLWSCS